MTSLNLDLSKVDPQMHQLIEKEYHRQLNGLELIASENYASRAVMQAQASVLTNKYAEGYPQKRYYDGCEYIDQIEQLAIDRAKNIFNVQYANVQPHSGASANLAVMSAYLKAGDRILGMDLSQGGHLTHGSPVNFSGKFYQAHHYGLDLKTERIDYNQVWDQALKVKPQMIIAGASAYPRQIDFKIFAEIAQKVDAILLCDMAHIAGLVATGLHPSPVGHCHIITSTTHKTLRGPRGGIILSNDPERAKKLNSAIFPGLQGGPLEHVIAAKAVAFKEALQNDFKDYQKQVISNAQTLGNKLQQLGCELVSGGTDNHLLLLKTDSFQISGQEASTRLETVGLTCNKNMVPNDTRSPFITSGVRLGTPAITTRGMKEAEMEIIAQAIFQTLDKFNDSKVVEKTRQTISNLCKEFPLYEN